ncbi:fibro-slime family protein [Fibrobacteria bacterium R8-3-H12]
MKNSACLKKILLVLVFGCCALFAQTRTFYFLPPDNDRWIAGTSYIYNVDTKKTEVMKIDTSCGWFKIEYSSSSAIPEKVLIFLGSQGVDKLDSNGAEAKLDDTTWIPLRDKFGTYTNYYLVAQTMLFTNENVRGQNNEKESNRCSYKMAAFIYDTDSTVNPSFRGAYCALDAASNPRCPGLPNNENQNGLRRGIVKPDLDTNTRKPIFNTKSNADKSKNYPYANWKDSLSFAVAFTPGGEYKGKVANVARCYDMPFGRASTGTWEFDSDKMLTPNGRDTVYGFYPSILDPAYISGAGYNSATEGDYSTCPTCRNEYEANCSTAMDPAKLNNTALRFDYNGKTYTGLEAFNRANDRLKDGWNTRPEDAPYNPYRDWGTPAANGHFSCAIRNGNNYTYNGPRPGPDGTPKKTANLSFCFESHAEFIYEKGQEFFFRGDDDIWVFINNRLVLDLGGIHSAVPGFVDLDSIKTPKPLEEGKTYPIDIFFCERMGSQSNVRVSTNMYITQKTTFYGTSTQKDLALCTNVSGANDCASKVNATKDSYKACGPNLYQAGYTVEFFMLQRGVKDTIWLTGIKNAQGHENKDKKCTGDDKVFTCYDGIKVAREALYSCGYHKDANGKEVSYNQCKGNSKAVEYVKVPPGNYTVYARLLDLLGKQQGKDLPIDNIKTQTSPRIVWGRLDSEDNSSTDQILIDAYGNTAKREQTIIAGKLTPIYVAGGKWKTNGDAVDKNYTGFIYDNDPTNNVTYYLSGTGDLKIYSDSLGEEEVTGFTKRKIPPGGIDTLWVKGGYELGDYEFNINVSDNLNTSEETPPLKLTLYQPRLRFTTDSSFATFVNPSSPSTASGFEIWTKDKTVLPYVNSPLDIYLVAWDSVQGKICEHCNFSIKEKSFTNNSDLNNLWGDGIVQGDAKRMENGKQIIYIRGKDVVKDDNFATWRISGPSGFTFAEWDKLQFRPAPIPMPTESYVYDRNGDGIGDSLIVVFGKSFRNEKSEILDSLLPVLLEVTWGRDSTVSLHIPDYDADYLKDKGNIIQLYGKEFFDKNRAFWDKYLIQTKSEEDILYRSLMNYDSEATLPDFGLLIIRSDDMAFSKDILTSGYNSGKGDIASYIPFYDQSMCDKCPDAFTYRTGGDSAFVLDRIPPIVIKATYAMDKTENCAERPDPGCRETLIAYLSEPVFADTASSFDIKNPFSYCFEYSQNSDCTKGASIQRSNQAWSSLDWAWEEAQKYDERDTSHSARYRPSALSSPPSFYEGSVSKGDSTIELIYRAYKIGGGPNAPTTRMPKATDWIKIRPPSLVEGGKDVFRDAAGNTANPREIGVLITGTNYYKKEQVKIAAIDKNATPNDPPLGGIFSENGRKPTWFSEEARKYADENLFKSEDIFKSNVTEFLPIPKGYPVDSAKTNYPMSIGTIFDVADNINNEVTKVWEDGKGGGCINGGCKDKFGNILTWENLARIVTIHASVYYHTNIGNYTAHKSSVEANCADDIFKKENSLNPSRDDCWGNSYNFYLAWDLKTNKNRFVGTGAYVAITKFYWQIDYEDANGAVHSNKFNKDEFIEMFGARRSK